MARADDPTKLPGRVIVIPYRSLVPGVWTTSETEEMIADWASVSLCRDLGLKLFIRHTVTAACGLRSGCSFLLGGKAFWVFCMISFGSSAIRRSEGFGVSQSTPIFRGVFFMIKAAVLLPIGVLKCLRTETILTRHHGSFLRVVQGPAGVFSRPLRVVARHAKVFAMDGLYAPRSGTDFGEEQLYGLCHMSIITRDIKGCQELLMFVTKDRCLWASSYAAWRRAWGFFARNWSSKGTPLFPAMALDLQETRRCPLRNVLSPALSTSCVGCLTERLLVCQPRHSHATIPTRINKISTSSMAALDYYNIATWNNMMQ
jgi:hypothetical protein